MKDDKILKGGPGLAGRGVYRDKMGAQAGVRHGGPGCNRLLMDTDSAQLRRLNLPSERRLRGFQADAKLHLFSFGTIAVRSHVDPGTN